MGTLNTRRIIQASLSTMAVGILVFSFNNCGKVQNYNFEPEQLQSYDEKVSSLSEQYHQKLGQDFCFDSKNYSCVHKTFSTAHQSADLGKSSESCVKISMGGEICPEIHSFVYNTKPAEEACQEGCNDNYNFQDYDCHLKLGPLPSGVYPLIVTTPDLESNIEQLVRSCVQIQRGL